MGQTLTLTKAAAKLGKSPRTLRRWRAKGAPIPPGERGPGRGATLSVEQVARWRAGVGALPTNDALDRLAELLWAVFTRAAAGYGVPAHRLLAIRDYQAALYLVHLWERVAADATNNSPPEYPKQIRDLIALAEQYGHK